MSIANGGGAEGSTPTPIQRALMFFGYFSGCGCLGSIILSLAVTFLISMCTNYL